MKKCFVKIESGKVAQKQPNAEEGFIEAPGEVVTGYIYNSKTKKFKAPSVVYDFDEELKKVRNEKLKAGLSMDGITVETDDVTQTRLMAIRIMAKEDSSYSVKWKTRAGFVDLNARTIVAIADAVLAHVQACFIAESFIDLSKIETLEGLQSSYDAAYLTAIQA